MFHEVSQEEDFQISFTFGGSVYNKNMSCFKESGRRKDLAVDINKSIFLRTCKSNSNISMEKHF